MKGQAIIHRNPVIVSGKHYDSFVVVFYLFKRRHRERYNTFERAYARAEEVATKAANGEGEALSLTGKDKWSYLAALDALRIGPEVSLEIAAREYAYARNKLGDVSLQKAVEFYQRHGASVLKSGPLDQILEELMAARQAEGRSHYHLRDLRRQVKRFVTDFAEQEIGNITAADINRWLRELDVKGRTRNNYRDAVHNFFNFAREEGYLPKDLPTAVNGIKRVNAATAENEVFTVEEAESLLAGAPPEVVPCLALKFFSGLRTEELVRIEWRHIKFSQDVIMLPNEITKTKQRRIVPLLPNLRQWLLPYVGATGRVAANWVMGQTLSKSWTNLAREIGVTYKKNAMRNSFISYRIAIVKNVAQVALESGNSPGVIQADYLELVTEADAQRWFAIFPKTTT